MIQYYSNAAKIIKTLLRTKSFLLFFYKKQQKERLESEKQKVKNPCDF